MAGLDGRKASNEKRPFLPCLYTELGNECLVFAFGIFHERLWEYSARWDWKQATTLFAYWAFLLQSYRAYSVHVMVKASQKPCYGFSKSISEFIEGSVNSKAQVRL